ncbi:ThiF family adenylyltransferase [Kibdelosporangium philippinense]|uniref:ThiF family adenylyltransferase n=1 Tax=Kibdelosporangium philippinense TaxID=211113 RepID=A0ABS8ZL55_9PSEU|nr:ThiF family adenylyltransferase [Kibdelosporangium philippinense]MCE7008227.1 ThiF family adenylyltransferase [Kibdelosporangium philippinense]
MSHDGRSLPRRPKVLTGLPVLRRGDGEIQLGLDPRHAVVIGGVTKTVAESIQNLDGQIRTRQLLAKAPPGDRLTLSGLLSELHELGLIEDVTETTMPGRLSPDAATWSLRTGNQPSQLAETRTKSSVLVHGSGRIGLAVAQMLVTAGIGAVEVDADGVVEPEDTGCGYLDEDIGKPRAEAARLRLPSGPVTDPDLVVLTDSAVPKPEFVTSLLSQSVPHLSVRVREGIGIVGPFVVPGRSSCLGCADLHRADLDQEWPAVAAQLVGQRQHADLTCAYATAAMGAEQAMRALEYLSVGGTRPPIWNETLELDPFHGKLDRRPWPPHVFCTCGARQ